MGHVVEPYVRGLTHQNKAALLRARSVNMNRCLPTMTVRRRVILPVGSLNVSRHRVPNPPPVLTLTFFNNQPQRYATLNVVVIGDIRLRRRLLRTVRHLRRMKDAWRHLRTLDPAIIVGSTITLFVDAGQSKRLRE